MIYMRIPMSMRRWYWRNMSSSGLSILTRSIPRFWHFLLASSHDLTLPLYFLTLYSWQCLLLSVSSTMDKDEASEECKRHTTKHWKNLKTKEKGRYLAQFYDKSPYTNRQFHKAKLQHRKRHQNFDCTTIADRLRMVSWSNDIQPTGVVKPV